MPRIYLDTCVLRLACEAKEDDERTRRARLELDRENATFLYSKVLELELLPMPVRNKQLGQVAYLREYFDSAEYIPCTEEALEIAMTQGCEFGMSCADAMHVGLAMVGTADELVTAEGATKPMMQITSVPVRSIAI